MLSKVASILVLVLAANSLPGQEVAALNSPSELKKLSLEQLMNLPVTTVSREPQPWFSSPSALQVLPGEEIRSSGITGQWKKIKTCPILYISQSEGTRQDHILAVLKGKPVLTVSDIETRPSVAS